ncbi:hypothetical protein K503DRAFT_372356 [Rhizopogon vinicolor AM-OR11-026]|uniref:Uncharacterized protein n=1 Tax=Rhizopogon vinicolor AM-OR11-026 TaxID=1314800 RepID=A0A1B7MRW9_9AGAM|nr:hypothetical protein K503DRAFT_372356 [Rhizopogon vinicolor AM-OR11-026]
MIESIPTATIFYVNGTVVYLCGSKPNGDSVSHTRPPLQSSRARLYQKLPVFRNDGQTLLIHNMDLVQIPRVGSTEPQNRRKLDRIKKRLEDDRGYLSDGGKVSHVSHTSKLQATSTGASPVLPHRAAYGSHSPYVSSMQRVSLFPQSPPITTDPANS